MSVDVPVVIVGAGPTGLMAALLLEQQGVETRVIERRSGPIRPPAAHAVNARTLEICRQAGVDMDALEAAAASPEDAGFVYWVDRIGGQTLGRLRYEQQGDDQLGLTPTPLRNLSQNRLEPLLVEALERRAGRHPDWGRRWVSSVETDSGIRTSLRDAQSGETEEITSRYLIAADGAGSPIRKSVGIDVEGPAGIQSFITVHLLGAFRGVPEIPPGVLFFPCDPETGGGTLVVHDLDREAVYMIPYDPEQESVDDYPASRCEAVVRAAMVDPDVAFEVDHVGAWTMTAQVATGYRAGNVFLAGDAAHRFPPTGGLGLNSGVQDAHNLAWKIAAVVQGRAEETLLDSYERERRPVAQTNAEQSLKNALRLLQVPLALGLTDAATASRAQLEATLADEAGRERVRQAIEDQAEHFDMPGLQLGFCYAEGALLRREDEETPPLEVRRFSPCGCPGARLPHAWLAEPGRSLLDRVPIARLLLIVGPDGQAWIEALGDPDVEALRVDEKEIPDLASWLATAGIGRDGALLVRPDQHVAWRAPVLEDEAAASLAQALKTVLGRPG